MEQINMDALFSAPDRRMESIRKWLRILLAVYIVMLSFSVLRNVISFGKLYNWINAALDVAVIFCLLQLRRENRLYKLAVGLMIADLVIGSIRSDYVAYYLRFLFSGHYELTLAVFRIISYIPLACSLGALAAEYMAHRRVIQTHDPKIGKYWLYLMIAGLAVSALASIIGSILASLIENGTLSIMIYQNYIFPLLRLPGIAISVLYMICLQKTERRLAKI
jgi:hypothetical protein